MNDGNNGQGAKQQIVEKIKQSSNILVTVSQDPSVDELSAALGLTVMLNTLGKHATAVVSGAIPPAIEFLEPGKTFENTVDSLRDFIIALDKEKADHLRYKVDGDVVKIFITPYRTTISEDDLQFSQGDYNVETVVALGVKSKEHLDKALEAHGRILHDATVATVSCGDEHSELGSIDWYEPSASSISEMLVSLSEALKGDKPVLDEQTSTAFLTGIVASTDRFSNNKTSPKVMTMAAQLMAAGANQQLIASKLEEAHEIGPDKNDTEDKGNSDGTTDLSEGESSKVNKKTSKKSAESKDDGSLAISHEKEGALDEVAKETAEQEQTAAAAKAEEVLADQLQATAPATTTSASPSVADLQKDLEAASAEVDQAASGDPLEPSLGGTLNATAEQAAEDKHREEEADRNKTILHHGSAISSTDSPMIAQSPLNASMTSDPSDDLPGVPMIESPQQTVATPAPQPLPPLPPRQTLADLDAQARQPHDQALADVHAAYEATPFNPANQPEAGIGAQPLGEVPHDTASGATPVETGVPPALPPLPDFSAPLPPPPPPLTFDQPSAAPTTPTEPAQPSPLGPLQDPASDPSAFIDPVSSKPNDPNQFQIPSSS